MGDRGGVRGPSKDTDMEEGVGLTTSLHWRRVQLLSHCLSIASYQSYNHHLPSAQGQGQLYSMTVESGPGLPELADACRTPSTPCQTSPYQSNANANAYGLSLTTQPFQVPTTYILETGPSIDQSAATLVSPVAFSRSSTCLPPSSICVLDLVLHRSVNSFACPGSRVTGPPSDQRLDNVAVSGPYEFETG
jgi:hypothetical protein